MRRAAGLLAGVVALAGLTATGCKKDPALVGGSGDGGTTIIDQGVADRGTSDGPKPMRDMRVSDRGRGGGDGPHPDMCTNTQTDPLNCGACGSACDLPNAFPGCAAGKCTISSCLPNWIDCDGNAANGCETFCIPTGVKACNNMDNLCDCKINEGFDLMTDPNNCGACGNVCFFPNAQAYCSAGKCTEINPATGGSPAPWPTDGPGPTCNAGFYNYPAPPACTTDADCSGGGHCDPLADSSGTHHCDQGCPYSCTPTNGGVEICDGIDNDCDGIVDDHLTDTGKQCYPSGLAGCTQTSGTWTCAGTCGTGTTSCAGGTLVCSGYTGPVPEICDGKDNDCDGVIDNGFNLMTDVNHCGACGNSCLTGPQAIPNANMACSSGACQLVSCKPGFHDDGNGTPSSPAPAPSTISTASRNPPVDCNYACAPTGAEVCNGLDDDCNHVVDEQPGTCTPGATGGSATCPALTPPSSFCNSKGPCAGTAPQCSMPGGTLSSGMTTCGNKSGVCWWCNYPTTCGGKTPCVQQTSPGVIVAEETLCDGIDNDCDGQIDETFPLAATSAACVEDGTLGTTQKYGACQGSGTVVCSSDKKSQMCSVTKPGASPANELCNGVDDDCDGLVDESWDDPAGTTRCAGGTARCQGVRQPIVQVNGDTGVSCANAGMACTAGPSCAAAGSSCPAGYHCGTNGLCAPSSVCGTPSSSATQAGGALDCNAPGASMAGTCACPGSQTCSGGTCHVPAFNVDQYEASRPDASGTAGGSTSSIACSASGVIPWTSVTEAEAQKACAAAGMRLCKATRSASGALTLDEWGTACQYNASWLYPYQTAYNGNTCNGADYTGAGAGAPVGTGALAACVNPSLTSPSGGLHDMSGNVKEWTNDPQGSGSSTVWTIRGGAYNSISPGLTCTFQFDVGGASYLFGDTGFRCCSSCTLPMADCNGTCVDLSSDNANCGACGSACSSGNCLNGVCCAAGDLWCTARCANPQTDPLNCGVCGNACASGKTCVSGTCL